MTVPGDEILPVRLYIIIPAAGRSQRMGSTSSKQFIPIGGIPVLARTLLAFEDYSSEKQKSAPFSMHGILVTSPESIDAAQKICEDFKITFIEKIIAGGSTRQESVWNGVCALQTLSSPPAADDITLIHDGARCFVEIGRAHV